MPALGADDVPSAGQRFGTDAALLLLQALAGSGRAVPLWFVTAGAEAVDGTETPRIEQAPVAGLARVAALEHPELRVTHIDLDPQVSPTSSADARALADELSAATHVAGQGVHESRVALRKGTRHVARLARQPRPSDVATDDAPMRLHIQERGTLGEPRHRARPAARARPARDRDPRAGQRSELPRRAERTGPVSRRDQAPGQRLCR